MHPEICEFISWLSYDGKLSSTDDCSQRKVAASGELTGTGLRYIPVQHSGSSQYSRAEALVIAKCCLELLEKDSTVTTLKGANRDVVTRSLVAADILVVAPYNLAVQEIAKVVPEGVRVGTVDKFQGQEAPVVFYAMTCSSAEDAPRGMSFLFDDHRLNVAISRAQCLAVLVANPRLLDAPARTIEQLELVNGVCELVSRAQEVEVIV